MSDLEKICQNVANVAQSMAGIQSQLTAEASRLRSLASRAASVRDDPGAAQAAAALGAASSACLHGAQALGNGRVAALTFVARTHAGARAQQQGRPTSQDDNGKHQDRHNSDLDTFTSPIHGFEMVYIDPNNADFSDNKIDDWDSGSFTMADYEWAVAAFATEIHPQVLQGATREDFDQVDQANGRPRYRQYGPVFDWFYGGDRIRVEQRADGTFDPKGGRHRLEMAQKLGVKRLPVWVIGSRS